MNQWNEYFIELHIVGYQDISSYAISTYAISTVVISTVDNFNLLHFQPSAIST